MMWWRAGYPKMVPNAPWHRCVETGKYVFVLDTKSLAIPHIGKWEHGRPLHELPPAELSLKLTVNGKTYHAREAEEASRFIGPRIVESGNFLQRADIRNLIFKAGDGTILKQKSRLETAAWGDQLGIILSAQPGRKPIAAGDACFGRVNGGFGLTGDNRLDIPAGECHTPETFTLSLWVFVPNDFKARQHAPWLVCKNYHEAADGNYGVVVDHNGIPSATLNIGGGANRFSAKVSRGPGFRREQWNHLAISYDGDTLRLFLNGNWAAETKVGKKRNAVPGGLAFGDRQDGAGNGGFRFRGVVDEIKLYGRALALGELRHLGNAPESLPPNLTPMKEWSFRQDVPASLTKLSEQWTSAALDVDLVRGEKKLHSRWELPAGQTWEAPRWEETAIVLNPSTFQPASPPAGITVQATEIATNKPRPVSYEPNVGWHKINLDGIEPIPPAGTQNPTNDAVERIKLQFSNSSEQDQDVRLMFEKNGHGFRQRIGSNITGMSAILRDAEGNPTGIPVQLSKNWHAHPEGGTYGASWFHGISLVHLPKGEKLELELTIAYGHWGGVAAASHSQLSLIGWGNNQLWDESALGSWGESICYDPDQHNANCTITDVRPMMIPSSNNNAKWNWTHNHGGGDFFRVFDPSGNRVPHAGMRTQYHKQGPCLTEVTYSGQIHNTGISHSATVSIARTDDVVCGTYRVRMDVTKPVDFSRFVIFQIGADTYISTREKKYAAGYGNGLIKEWDAQWGGNAYRGEPVQAHGHVTWVSLHDAFIPEGEVGARANRGVVVRNWKGRLGGKEVFPWFAEHGIERGGNFNASTMDLVPPPNVKRLEPGDFVEATIEHVLVPRLEKDYYGPNTELRAALAENQNTWKMIHRQAVDDRLTVTPAVGHLLGLYPDVRILTDNDRAEYTLTGGVGYVPLTFKNLSSPKGHVLTVDGQKIDQHVHGNDFWQTDYDPRTGRWSQTYNIPGKPDQTQTIRFGPAK